MSTQKQHKLVTSSNVPEKQFIQLNGIDARDIKLKISKEHSKVSDASVSTAVSPSFFFDDVVSAQEYKFSISSK